MTSTTRSTRTTQADVLAAILGLTEAVNSLVSQQAPVVAAAPVEATAKAATRTRKTAAPKAGAKKATSTKAPAKVRLLSRKSRVAFVAAAAKEGVTFEPVDGVNWSTQEIAAYCVAEGYAPKGFGIGAGYTELFSA